MTSRAATVVGGSPRAHREVTPIMALTAPRPPGAIGAARRAYRLGRDRSNRVSGTPADSVKRKEVDEG
jgi:hypothetical protein